MKKFNIAVVGASGLVGSKMIEMLAEFDVPVQNLYLFAGENGSGKKVKFKNLEIEILRLSKENIFDKKIDFALFSAGEKVSKEFAKEFIKLGATVIDNSSAFRLENDVPLIVPETNFNSVSIENKLISNPNCSTIQCIKPLEVINTLFGLKFVNFTTFQAVSGSGQKGILDFERTMNGEEKLFYPYRIFSNVLPHIGDFLGNGYSKEEMKMILETRKILNLKKLKLSATCVRVPILNSHSVEIDLCTKTEINVNSLKQELNKIPNIKLLDEPEKNIYPQPLLATNQNKILVGRIRRDLFDKKRLHLFCSADNLRKGAATNAVEILLKCIEKFN